MWQEGQGLPADGWYDGNAETMIENGTYEDYRTKLELRAKDGFYGTGGDMEERVKASMKKLQKWDEMWEAIPLDERIEKRDKVIDDTTPKLVTEMTNKGPVQTLKAKPSGSTREVGKKKPRTPRTKRPSGAISSKNDPLRKKRESKKSTSSSQTK
jgi:hypothetical protein